MKKIGVIMLMAATVMTAGSCGGKGGEQHQQQMEEEPDTTAISTVNRDSTVYGICIDGSAMNTLQLLTDVGDTLNLSIAEANEKGMCYGGFQVGDRIALMLKDKKTAKLVITSRHFWVTGLCLTRLMAVRKWASVSRRGALQKVLTSRP